MSRYRTAAGSLAAVGISLFLGACSGTLPVQPETVPAAAASTDAAAAVEAERAYAASLKAARKAVDTKHPRRRPMTAQHIGLEWNTLALHSRRPERATRQARQPALRPTPPAIPSLSLEALMASEDCHACELRPFHDLVLQASDEHGVPPGLIHAVIQKESAYDPDATSPHKARGLMQVTAGAARQLGIRVRNLYDPKVNIHVGTAYLKYLIDLHDSVEEVLAAYNAGPGNVRKYNGVPPFPETRRYVREVKQLLYSMWTPPLALESPR
ncbi:MAG: lytic transglycosylase domain-containing protein [Noviherbaspirillum sp.]